MIRLPLVILGGSDREPSVLPAAGAEHHPLAVYKGAELRVGGRPLVALLVERLRTAPEFDDVAIAGPARLYAGLAPDARVIDTDGHLGENLAAAIEDLSGRGCDGPFAIASCDMLPDPADLRRALDTYVGGPPCAVWFPLIRIPDEARGGGAFGWKPSYRLVDRDGAPARVWPGHIGIVDPSKLRVRFLLQLLESAYGTRNLPVGPRQRRMAAHLIGRLVRADLGRLATLRPPSRTWNALTGGLRVARGVREGTLTIPELERVVGRLVLRERRERPANAGVRTVIVDGLTLAEDVDTEEEAAELARTLAARGVPATIESTATTRAPERRIGRYRLVERIGRGAMADVWRATDPDLQRDVAVKILSEAVMGEPDTLRRFERETRAVASLSHPNVVAIHDVGVDAGRAFAVTELLEGETLRARLARGPMPQGEIASVLLGAARGLAAVHEQGIVHRDVKPENVFLTRSGGVKVLDFGLVRRRRGASGGSSLQTTLGTLLGTPDYMSPEQVRGEELDGRSDLFSLGAVAHEMVSGRRLFSRETPADTLAAILLFEPGPPRPPRGKLGGALLEVVRGCLVKAREDRLGSAAEVVRLLTDAGEGRGEGFSE